MGRSRAGQAACASLQSAACAGQSGGGVSFAILDVFDRLAVYDDYSHWKDVDCPRVVEFGDIQDAQLVYSQHSLIMTMAGWLAAQSPKKPNYWGLLGKRRCQPGIQKRTMI